MNEVRVVCSDLTPIQVQGGGVYDGEDTSCASTTPTITAQEIENKQDQSTRELCRYAAWLLYQPQLRGKQHDAHCLEANRTQLPDPAWRAHRPAWRAHRTGKCACNKKTQHAPAAQLRLLLLSTTPANTCLELSALSDVHNSHRTT
jgi:hypothetical protein